MLFAILNTFFTIVIIILFVRYFIERYQYYGFGPVMMAVMSLTDKMLTPIKQALPRSANVLQSHTPLIAILLLLILRGLAIKLIATSYSSVFIQIMGDLAGRGSIPLFQCMGISLSMGIQLLAELLNAFLFASVMISRRGVTMYGNAGFICFQERTFAIFKQAKKIVHKDDLKTLFVISSVVILIGASALASLTGVTFFPGLTLAIWFKGWLAGTVASMFEILSVLIQVYWFVLLLTILSSWLGADRFRTIVQIVKAMADPYLEFFRRLCPWARIDFIDLSPIFAFLLISPGLTYALSIIKGYTINFLLYSGTNTTQIPHEFPSI